MYDIFMIFSKSMKRNSTRLCEDLKLSVILRDEF